MLNLTFNIQKIILLLFAVGSLLVVNTTTASACTCVFPAPPKDSLEKSTAVFVGKVVDIDVPSKMIFRSSDPVKVTLEVSKIWKGPDYKTLVLTTARDGASCGYSFKQDEEYVVYAYGEEDKLSTDICRRTKLLASAQEDLQELGEGKLPTNSGSSYIPQTFTLTSIAFVGIVIVLIVIYAVIRISSKIRRPIHRRDSKES